MSDFRTKSARLVEGLVSFIKDTKPYHVKLTEVQESYYFNEAMHVTMQERLSSRTKFDSRWRYEFFSDGNGVFRQTVLQRVLARAFSGDDLTRQVDGRWKIGRDEHTDMASVPFAYSKKAFDGIGVVAAYLQNGATFDRTSLLEGHDFYQSHGSFEFQVRQINDVGLNFRPRWEETKDRALVSEAKQTAIAAAYDQGSATSSWNRIQDLLAAYLTACTTLGVLFDAVASEVLLLQDVFANGYPTGFNGSGPLLPPQLPLSYDGLISAVGALTGPQFSALMTEVDGLGDFTYLGSPFANITAAQDAFQMLTPDLVLGYHGDSGFWNDGTLRYEKVIKPFLVVYDINSDPAQVPYEEVVLRAITTTDFEVSTISRGLLGVVTAGSDFNSSFISFRTRAWTNMTAAEEIVAEVPREPVVGDVLTLTPAAKVTLAPDAALETWNLIKVNPISYTRPLFSSVRWGYVTSPRGDRTVRVDSASFPTSTIRVDAQNATTWLMTGGPYLSPAVVTTGVPYSDGLLTFTIIPGTAYAFQAGDYFTFDVVNPDPQVHDLNVGFSFDMEPYDAYDLLDDQGRPLNFRYDTRFPVPGANLITVGVSNSLPVGPIKVRLRALRDETLPIAWRPGVMLGGEDVSNAMDLSLNSGNLSGASNFDGPDADLFADLRAWYSTSWALEVFDNTFQTWRPHRVDENNPLSPPVILAHGEAFTSQLGFSFTAPSSDPAQPFIATAYYEQLTPVLPGAPSVDGGDTIEFRLTDDPPYVANEPIQLISPRFPTLLIHGDDFHDTPAAVWTVLFSSPTDYTVQGTLAGGGVYYTSPEPGSLALAGAVAREGATFRDPHTVHFTVVPGVLSFDAGDAFTFTTYERKPSYLVHGSASGYFDPATVGEWYWNGHIGFKIDRPDVDIFRHDGVSLQLVGSGTGVTVVGTGTIDISRVRFDAPSLTYIIKKTSTGMVLKVDGTTRQLTPGVLYEDTYLSLTIDVSLELELFVGDEVLIKITPDAFPLAKGHNAVLLEPAVNPQVGDYVLARKAHAGDLALTLNTTGTDALPLDRLQPQTIDVRYIDLNTYSGVPLENTSPDTALIHNFIPLRLDHEDSVSSIAEFPDQATSVTIRASATNETIGRVFSLVNDPDNVVLEWDAAFYADFLPINASANLIVTTPSSWNETLHVHMTESLRLLVSGGALFEDWLFSDTVNVGVSDALQINITSYMNEAAQVSLDDTFGDFMPGYDTYQYDGETLDGQYDTGYPLTDYYDQAVFLENLPMLTPEQETRLEVLLNLIRNYLTSERASDTSRSVFHANVEADPYLEGTAPHGFGLPTAGLGVATKSQPGDVSATSFTEAMVFTSEIIAAPYDDFDFDTQPMDNIPATIVLMSVAGTTPPMGLTWATTETGVEAEGRIFKLQFPVDTPSIPAIQVWEENGLAPFTATVHRVNTRTFKFLLASPGHVKVAIA